MCDSLTDVLTLDVYIAGSILNFLLCLDNCCFIVSIMNWMNVAHFPHTKVIMISLTETVDSRICLRNCGLTYGDSSFHSCFRFRLSWSILDLYGCHVWHIVVIV
jgi:hypothetical protein